jgi:hypothetical protein
MTASSPPPDRKIIDIISEPQETTLVSLEYFPPRTDEGVTVRHHLL